MVNTIRIAFVVLALCLSTGDRIASAGKAAPVATKSSAKSAKMAPTPAPSAKTSPATNRLAGLIKGRRGKGAPEPRKAASKAQRADGAAKTASRASQEPSTLRLLTLEGPRLTYRAIKSHPRLFARGVFLDGPKHAYKAIARHKKAFFGGMAAVASAGAVSHAFDVNLEPAVLAVSIALLGIQARDALRYIHRKGLTGADAARVIGERLAFPMLLVNSSTVAGFAVAGGEHAAAGQALITKAATGAAANGLIGGDSPAIMATILAGKDESH